MKNQKTRITNFIINEYNRKPEYLWEKFPNHFIFRHQDNKKWFALIANVAKEKVGINEKGNIDILNIKLNPFEVNIFKTQQGFFPAYHMNKQKWLTARLDDSVPDEILEELINNSFNETKNS